MTPESYGLVIALTFAALLLAALGALLLFKGAREDCEPPSLVLTDGGIRIGDGANVLRFRLEVQPSGRTAFRARRTCASNIPARLPSGRPIHNFQP